MAVEHGIFRPVKCRGVEFANHMVVPPMCTGLAEPGSGEINDRHMTHYGSICKGGFGLMIVEATGVEYRGHISALCLGIYTEAQIAGHRRLNDYVHRNSVTKTCLQIAHAGRKGVTDLLFGTATQAPRFLDPSEKFGVEAVAPSAVPHDQRKIALHELSLEEIDVLKQTYRVATLNAIKAGYDCLELHAAHGYLLHQFVSPISNFRTDRYGGSIDNRSRLTLEIVELMRQVMPSDMPLFVRISATDWAEGGCTIEDSVYFTRKLLEAGADVIDVSSGGVSDKQNILSGWSYQTDLAKTIRSETGARTIAVGRITTLDKALQVFDEGCADFVAIGRSVLRDPYWLRREAKRLELSGVVPLHPIADYKQVDLPPLWESESRISSVAS